MSLSVVNGYVCENTCDVAKAKKGEDPHPKVGAEVGKADARSDGTSDSKSNGTSQGVAASTRVDGPAVVFGGSLVNANGAATGDAPSAEPTTRGTPIAPGKNAPGSVLNILA